MSMDKLQRLVELDEQRADLEKQTAAIVSEMRSIIGDGFAIAGAKVVPVRRGAGALKTVAAPSPLAPGETPAPVDLGSAKDKAGTQARVLAYVGGSGEAGVDAPTVAAALGLRMAQVTNALLSLKEAKQIRRVSRGVYAAKT